MLKPVAVAWGLGRARQRCVVIRISVLSVREVKQVPLQSFNIERVCQGSEVGNN